MNDTEKLAAVTKILATHLEHYDNPDGGKYQSDRALAIEAVEGVIFFDTVDYAKANGFLPKEF
jgi:hypothetical protein